MAEARGPFERAYHGFLRSLYEGRVHPGQKISAPDMMREYDVGRGTVREVLNRLSAKGIISMTPHKGAEVRRLTRTDVYDLLDIVEVLLGLASRSAARAMSEARSRYALVQSAASLTSVDPCVSFDAFLVVRDRYYRSILDISGNPELRLMFPSPQIQIMRMQLRHFDHAADAAAFADFEPLTAAILSGNGPRAELAGRDHVRNTKARVAQLPNSAFAPAGQLAPNLV